jgi:hypothetical protein
MGANLPIEIVNKIMLYISTPTADCIKDALEKINELHENKKLDIPRDILPKRYKGYWIEEDGSYSEPLWVHSVFLNLWCILLKNRKITIDKSKVSKVKKVV